MSYDCISIIGLGYIGLPTAAVFASREKKVIGVDVNQNTVDIINAGKVHIVEPGLEVMVEEGRDSARDEGAMKEAWMHECVMLLAMRAEKESKKR